MKPKRIIVIDKTGRETTGKTRRRDRLDEHVETVLPDEGEELHARTKNKLLRQLADEAKTLGNAAGTVWKMRAACGDEVDGDVVSAAKLERAFAILRTIENDAYRAGYTPEKYLPPLRSAFLSGLIERIKSERK